MAQKKTPNPAQGASCFVAMPIRKVGSEEFRHFDTIFLTLSDAATALGFDVVRADKVSTSGNITKDIIIRLATADVVIADLTDLNPNVFYEIGLRHAMRRHGTILLIDKDRSPVVPFDLNSYRVIHYVGDIHGVRELQAELVKALTDLAANLDNSNPSAIDSPVHDWFPELPSDLIASSRQTTDRAVADELAQLRRQVEHYRELASSRHTARRGPGSSTIDIIQRIRQADDARELEQQFLVDGNAAADANDVGAFLDATERLLRSPQESNVNTYFRFTAWADRLGLRDLRVAVLQEAMARYPNSSAGDHYFRAISTSSSPEERSLARNELSRSISLDVETGEFTAPVDDDTLSRNIGHLLQMLHAEGVDDHALKIAERAMSMSDSFTIAKEWARQLAWNKDFERTLEAYRSCIRSDEVDSEAVTWFGNFLHNNGYHVESAELFVLAAFIDLDDAGSLLHVADELSFHMYEYFTIPKPKELAEILGEARPLPEGLGREAIAKAVGAAVSSGNLDPANRDLMVRTLRRCDMPLEEVEAYSMTKDERISWLCDVYTRLVTSNTQDCPAGLRLLASKELFQTRSYEETAR